MRNFRWSMQLASPWLLLSQSIKRSWFQWLEPSASAKYSLENSSTFLSILGSLQSSPSSILLFLSYEDFVSNSFVCFHKIYWLTMVWFEFDIYFTDHSHQEELLLDRHALIDTYVLQDMIIVILVTNYNLKKITEHVILVHIIHLIICLREPLLALMLSTHSFFPASSESP